MHDRTKNSANILTAALCLLLAAPVVPALDLGDPAPELSISEWVKGEPVKLGDNDGKKIYVIDFWATWCGPCVYSIPHLSELQKKYRDQGVIVVGITDENPAKVKDFVEKMGERMNYAVAIDDHEQSEAKFKWAVGQTILPYVFVIDREGNLAWHGYLMNQLDLALDDVVANRHRQTAILLKQQKMAQAYFRLALDGADEAARKAGEEIYRFASADADSLSAFAFTILTAEELRAPDYDLALQCAVRANELAGEKNAAVLDTLAYAHFRKNNLTQAIALEKKAIEICDDQKVLVYLEKNLAHFQKEPAGQPAQ